MSEEDHQENFTVFAIVPYDVSSNTISSILSKFSLHTL